MGSLDSFQDQAWGGRISTIPDICNITWRCPGHYCPTGGCEEVFQWSRNPEGLDPPAPSPKLPQYLSLGCHAIHFPGSHITMHTLPPVGPDSSGGVPWSATALPSALVKTHSSHWVGDSPGRGTSPTTTPGSRQLGRRPLGGPTGVAGPVGSCPCRAHPGGLWRSWANTPGSDFQDYPSSGRHGSTGRFER